jgi:hypothetical protein
MKSNGKKLSPVAKENKAQKTGTHSEIVIYQSSDGKIKLDCRIESGTLWLSQTQIAQLFGRERSVITKHIRNIFAEGELEEKSNVQNLHIAHSDKPVTFYSLDIILAVGYRVKSTKATLFRQWATSVLHEYLQKGFVLHYAVSGHTASEIVFDRANAELPFMGLTVFKGSRPVRSEVAIAKNYMTEKGLFALRRMVNAFFDMAELKAESHEPMYMRDWLEMLDKFTGDFGFGVLEGVGSVSNIEAIEKAHREYDAYRVQLPDDLTDVEKAYLDTLRDMQKKLKDGGEEV